MTDVDMPRAVRAVEELLRAIGEDPDRPGLADTPVRVARFWQEFLNQENGDLLRIFPEGEYDEMVVLRDVRFYSLCEHHLLPFFGTAAVAYVPVPEHGVIGLSKLARIVRKHAGRLQVQERLTRDIATEIEELTQGKGVGVSVSAEHLCASMRGVRSQDSQFVTNVLRGVMLTNPAARAEFLDAIHR